MSGMNRWQGIINVGTEPEMRATQGGQSVLSFRGACNEKYQANGQEKETVTWLGFAVWGKRAEGLARHIKKGDRLLVEGPLRIGEYDDRDGNKRTRVEVVINGLEFMGGSRDRGGAPEGGSGYGGAAASGGRPAGSGGGYARGGGQARGAGGGAARGSAGAGGEYGSGPSPEDDGRGGDYGGSGTDDLPF